MRLRHREAIPAFTADGKVLISVGDDSTIRGWDPATGAEVRRTRLHGLDRERVGKMLAQNGKVVVGWLEGALRVWDTVTAREKRSFPVGEDELRFFCPSPDGKILAALTRGYARDKWIYRVRLWDVGTGKEHPQLDFTKGFIKSFLAFSPDGKLLGTLGHDKALRLWETATGKEVRTIPDAAGDGLAWGRIVFSCNGKLVAAGESPAAIKVWDVTSGAKKVILKATPPIDEAVFCLAFSPDDKTLAAGTWSRLLLWDVATGKQLHKIPITCKQLAFSPDGKTLATADKDSLRLWDVATGKERFRRALPGKHR
jgi:WD40 repeat protein